MKKASTVIGAAVLFSAFLGFLISLKLTSSAKDIALPHEMVLFLDFESGFVETNESVSFADPFSAPSTTLHDMIETLDTAKDDPRVKGILARYGGGSYSLAHVQEFRAAMERFKDSGKFSYIYSPSYGDGGGFVGYYLASCFDEIWMQPMGIVAIPGLKIEMPYIRGLLDKIGILPEFIQYKRYKTANENITRPSMSVQNREMLIDILTQSQTTLLQDISKARDVEEGNLIDFVEKAIFTAEEGLESKLINHAGYTDELIDVVKEKTTGSTEASDKIFIRMDSYNRLMARKKGGADWMHQARLYSKPGVALIYANGMILQSAFSNTQAFASQSIAAADEIVPAIWEAIEDPSILAIVLRVDSPGGSPVASESILRALQQAQDHGKPVYVSMGPTAASGGYWISASADQIFAMPTTLTGSIGVVGGKVSVKKLSDDYGVKWEGLEWGDAAGLWSVTSPFSQSQREKMERMLTHVYDSFVSRVALGRNLSEQQVENVAKGRVWTGQNAMELGLVDQMGTLHDTLNYAATQLGVQSRGDLDILILPRPKTRLERLIALLSDSGSVMASLRDVLGTFEGVKAVSGLDTLRDHITAQGRPMTYQATAHNILTQN
ncbi:MAG: signal peptide peptidase SppA [Pseudomonadota bacterium]